MESRSTKNLGLGNALEIREGGVTERVRGRHWRVTKAGDRFIAPIASLELICPCRLEYSVNGGRMSGGLVQAAVECRSDQCLQNDKGEIAYANSPSVATRPVTLNVSNVVLPVEGRGNNPELRIAVVRLAAILCKSM